MYVHTLSEKKLTGFTNKYLNSWSAYIPMLTEELHTCPYSECTHALARNAYAPMFTKMLQNYFTNWCIHTFWKYIHLHSGEKSHRVCSMKNIYILGAYISMLKDKTWKKLLTRYIYIHSGCTHTQTLIKESSQNSFTEVWILWVPMHPSSHGRNVTELTNPGMYILGAYTSTLLHKKPSRVYWSKLAWMF